MLIKDSLFYSPAKMALVRQDNLKSHFFSSDVILRSEMLSPILKGLRFFLTNACNLRCKYCYVNEYSTSFLSRDKWLYLCDLLILSAQKNFLDKIDLSFLGGEPFLAFDSIKEIIDYISQALPNMKIKSSIVTNGTLFDECNLLEIKRYKIDVAVSLDGCKNTHDKMRIDLTGNGSYDMVIRGCLLYRDYIGKMPSVRLTLSNHNCDLFSEIKFLVNMGFRNFFIGIDSNIKECNLNNLNFNGIFDLILEYLFKNDFIHIQLLDKVVQTFAAKIFWDNHCSAGFSNLSLGLDGSVYFCHRFASNNLKPILSIDLLDMDKIELILYKNFMKVKKSQDFILECKNCDVVGLCGGLCFYEKSSKSKDDLDKICYFYRFIYKEYMLFLSYLKKDTLDLMVKSVFDFNDEYFSLNMNN